VARKTWEQHYYVPFYRVFEDAGTREEFLKAPKGKARYISAQIRELKGSERKLGDPLENMLHNWMHLINESMRNIAREEAFEFGKDNFLKELKPSDMSNYHSVRDKNGKQITYVHKKTNATALMFQRNGKPVYFEVYDNDLFNALGGLNVHDFDNLLFKMMRKTKKWLTYGATFSPAFRIANAIRDTMQVALIHKSFKPFMDSAKGVAKAWKESPEYIAFMAWLRDMGLAVAMFRREILKSWRSTSKES
jgi:hypothetical protein